MSKKPHRSAPALDMTAMVDVAFLLLTFFILTTTKFREDTSAEVKVPGSISDTKAPETNLMTVTVSDSGKIFVGFSDIKTRESVIQDLITQGKIKTTPEGIKTFAGLQDFGVPMGSLGDWLSKSAADRKAIKQTGVPAVDDTLNNVVVLSELKEWIKVGRIVDHNDGDDKELRIAIKGDAKAPYPYVQKVMSALQDFNINQFNLLTDQEAGGAKPAEGKAPAH